MLSQQILILKEAAVKKKKTMTNLNIVWINDMSELQLSFSPLNNLSLMSVGTTGCVFQDVQLLKQQI